MTARKKGGASASQFVISMDDGEDTEESNVVGRLKATTRTSEEFQVQQKYSVVFFLFFTGLVPVPVGVAESCWCRFFYFLYVLALVLVFLRLLCSRDAFTSCARQVSGAFCCAQIHCRALSFDTHGPRGIHTDTGASLRSLTPFVMCGM